jgi:4-amino-4-deoxy-L-arabinose transferase-like glycosyltransferase
MITTASGTRTHLANKPGIRGRLVNLLFAANEQPAWVRPSVLALLTLTGVLYLTNLGANGYANDFYAAAVQSGTQSWKALLFGSLDPANSITVDKPPAALWVMALSGRLFGFSSWSMLVPQALAGVAAVGLLYATVRRWSGPLAGLLAGAAFALTPVAALMFRFNNPDALLVLLLVAAAYCTVRAIDDARLSWLVVAGVFIGFGFLTKMIQAFLVVPGLALVYLVVAPTGLWRRIGHLLAAGLAVVVSSGWYVALVDLWPTSARPYIGGSTDNSLLQLAFGYNGFSRVFGGFGNGSPGGGGMGGPGGGKGPGGGHGFGGPGSTMFGGNAGIGRLFGESMGTQISWLLPAALIGLVACLWFTRRDPRTGKTRAALMLWGGWLLVTGLVFSFMQGTIHPYYTVALAPAVAGLIGISGQELWKNRRNAAPRFVLAAMVAVTGVWDFVLLGRTSDWLPAMRWIILIVAVLLAVLLAADVRQLRKLAPTVAILVLLTAVTGSAAYTVDTVTTSETGGIPIAGPEQPMMGMPGVGGGGSNGPGPRGVAKPSSTSKTRHGSSQPPGGMFDMASNTAVLKLINTTHTQWAAATIGSQGAASIELATGKAVMAVGGFTGSDNSPTLAQFQQDVRAGKITYFISADQHGPGGHSGGNFGGPGGPGSSGTSGQITQWVKTHYASKNVGGQTIYDLHS